MDRHIKNGMVSMGVWIIFLVVLFGSYLTITDTPFSCLLDEETGGFISAAFFIAWALIWFGIGRHYSLDYELKEQAFIKKYEGIDETIRLTMFKKAYFSNIAHMLSRVFFIAVPFYVAANVKDTVTLKNCIYIAILMIASIALYGYYKRTTRKTAHYSSIAIKIGQAKANDDCHLLDRFLSVCFSLLDFVYHFIYCF